MTDMERRLHALQESAAAALQHAEDWVGVPAEALRRAVERMRQARRLHRACVLCPQWWFVL